MNAEIIELNDAPQPQPEQVKKERRQWTDAEKREILKEVAAGDTVQEVAARHGINPVQIWKWNRKQKNKYASKKLKAKAVATEVAATEVQQPKAKVDDKRQQALFSEILELKRRISFLEQLVKIRSEEAALKTREAELIGQAYTHFQMTGVNVVNGPQEK